MKLNIAICDDDPTFVQIINGFITKIQTPYEIQIIHALSGEVLLDKAKYCRFDVVFLDIEMQEMNGIETGKRIRQLQADTIIVYITGFKGYALHAFKVEAIDYILKPITKEKFQKTWKKIVVKLEEKKALQEKQQLFIIQNKEEIIRLKYEEIICFEKLYKKIKIYSERKDYEFYSSMKEVKQQIDEEVFIQCHQGYIVNASKILEVKEEGIYVREKHLIIPVSRRYKGDVKRHLEKNLFD